jgi:hypothetical protein
MLQWNALAMTAMAPDDDYQLASDLSLDFSFTGPSLAKSPAVEVSTTSDFSNKKCLLTLAAKKGVSGVTLTNSVLTKFLKKDDGDNILYWRVIDKGFLKTTVDPSASRCLNISN